MRYLLFSGHDYSGGGGWDDFVKAFEDAGEAKAACLAMIDGRPLEPDWSEIIDLTKLSPVFRVERGRNAPSVVRDEMGA